jgi:hypothetical protein
MSAGRAALIAVDGINGAAVRAAARAALTAVPRARRGGVSVWDASGVFGDLVVAGDDAGRPSARTLLLLYAADLAFRLRWEIRPALADGRVVVAAPYVASAVALGLGAGLPGRWLNDLFAFAPRPSAARCVGMVPARRASDPSGFFEFGCERLTGRPKTLSRRLIIDLARRHLEGAVRGGKSR